MYVCMGCPNKSARLKVRSIVAISTHGKLHKEQRVIIVKSHYKHGESHAEKFAKFVEFSVD